MIDPEQDAIRVVENELADKGFSGYSVSAKTTGRQVAVSVSKTGDSRTAVGTMEMFMGAIEQANLDGVSLEQEFENYGLYR